MESPFARPHTSLTRVHRVLLCLPNLLDAASKWGYKEAMLIVTFDPPKRAINLRVHGLDFAMIEPAFFEDAVVVPAKKGRLLALGRIEGKPYAVVFQPLGTEAVSVISLRIASIKERRLL